MDFDIKPYYNYILKIYISGLLPQIVKFDCKSNLNLASFVCLLLNKHMYWESLVFIVQIQITNNVFNMKLNICKTSYEFKSIVLITGNCFKIT